MFSILLKFIRGIGATPGLTFHLEVQEGVGPVIFPNSALTRQNIHVIELDDLRSQAVTNDNGRNQ